MSKIHELAFNAEEIDELLDSVDKKTIYQDATQSEHGLMSTTDKTKLDNLPTEQQIADALNGKVDKVEGKGLSENDYTDVEKESVASAYHKPQKGIPKTDLDSSVQTSLDNADSALQSFTETDPTVPSWAKQPNKPSYNYSEIGNTPDLSGFITKSVNDLTNYYLKTDTYTQAEVNSLIGSIQHFHYEIYPTLPEYGERNVLYLIGPIGSGSDRYEEYVYTRQKPKVGFIKIGDTSIDLSGYVTTSALNTALADYTTTAALTTLLAGKQDTISDLATIRSGAAIGATAYQKPSTGIPASDLASGVIPTVPVQDVTVGGTSVVSNGVAAVPAIPDVSGKADKTSVVTPTGSSVTQELADNTIYQASTLSSLTITLPNGLTPDYISQINFTSGSTATTLTAPNTIVWFGDDLTNNVFVPTADKQYVVMFYYDGVNVRGAVQSYSSQQNA